MASCRAPIIRQTLRTPLMIVVAALPFVLRDVPVFAQTYVSLTPSPLNIAGASCTPNGAISTNANGFVVCASGLWAQQPLVLGSQSLTCSLSLKGQMQWTGTAFQYCDGSTWTAIQYSSGSVGYLVMSKSTYTGNLGGLSGADAACLTDLTTNTGWKGYATANTNSLLTSGKIRALLCDGSTCHRLQASTTYTFANAANSAYGGDTMTTDANGYAPGDSSNNWSASTYFGASVSYFTGMVGGGVATMLSYGAANTLDACNAWTSASALVFGETGSSNATNANRWAANATGDCSDAANNLHLLCMVNP